MKTYKDFRDYLEGVIPQTSEIKSLQVARDWVDIMELQLNFQEYPALVVEIPDIELGDVGGMEINFHFNFSVIQAVAVDDPPEAALQALNDTLELAIEVNWIFFCDSEKDEVGFRADLSNVFQKIIKATPDNCYGWRGEGTFKISRDL